MTNNLDQSMQIMEIVESIDKAIQMEDLSLFKDIIEPFIDDINQYIIEDDESNTAMNILHIIASRESDFTIINNNDEIRSNIYYKMIDMMRQCDRFDVNFRATIEGQYNLTAAHIAIQWQNISMLQSLIAHGVDLLICDCDGKNVQDYACEIGNEQLITLIKQSIYETIESRQSKFPDQNQSFHDYYHAVPVPVDYDSNHHNYNDRRPPHQVSSSAVSTMSYPKSSSNDDERNSPLNLSSIHMDPSTDRFDSFATVNSQASSSQLNMMNDAFYDRSSMIFHSDTVLNQSNHKENNDESFETKILVKEKDIELIEQCFESVTSPLNQSNDSNESSNESTASSIDEFILKLNDKQLRDELNQIGFEICGPLNSQTRRCYQRKYHILRKNTKDNNDIRNKPSSKLLNNEIQRENSEILVKMSNYNIEFDMIRSKKFPFMEAHRYEQQLIERFAKIRDENDNRKNHGKNRNGNDQTYFVYLLLDPLITKNLPAKVNILLRNDDDDDEHPSTADYNPIQKYNTIINDYRLFYQFISSIFYVGKGKNDRPYQHIIDAKRMQQQQQQKQSKRLDIQPKIRRIWSIWQSNAGPISLHDCQYVTSDEAQTREALIIETIGLFNLTNQISGTYRQQLRLNQRQKSLIGTYLLYKFFIMYLLTGERQIRLPSQ